MGRRRPGTMMSTRVVSDILLEIRDEIAMSTPIWGEGDKQLRRRLAALDIASKTFRAMDSILYGRTVE